MSQAQLGAPFLTRAAISLIEHGVTSPSLSVLAHCTSKLKVTVVELLTPSSGALRRTRARR